MAGTILSGTYTTGIVLDNPATQRPVTITGKVTNTNAAAVYGQPLFAWTVNNSGTIQNTGTAGYGIHLAAGGAVNNAAARLIAGYGGILIRGAAGVVGNLGTIQATGANSRGVNMTAGGRVTNGSAALTASLIAGSENAVFVDGGAGTVTNFGRMTNTENNHSAVGLFAGGSVTNGSSASTAASIAGAGGGVYGRGGLTTVTNFGSISGVDGVFFDDGGRVTNGQSGATAGRIVGTAFEAVRIAGAAGTVANFGTVQESGILGSVFAVALDAGGTVTNGASGAKTALITGANGIYAANSAATVTNFGFIEATSANSGTGVALHAGGSVANFGTIEDTSANAAVYLGAAGTVTNGSSIVTTALIDGAAGHGVLFNRAAGSVTNFGTITSGFAIALNAGGSVVNGRSGSTAGLIDGVSVGVQLNNLGSVANFGTIEGTGTFGNGVSLNGGGSVTNGQSGSTAGLIQGANLGIFVDTGSVTNFGTISGATGFFEFGTGNNTLANFGTVASTAGTAGVAVEMSNSLGKDLVIVEKGAVFTGLVEGGGRSEIEFAAAGAAAMPAKISGFQTVMLANGVGHSLTLTDPNFVGVTGNRITVIGGNAGNTVSAATVAGSAVTMDGGAGKDLFTGGSGNDFFRFTAATLGAGDVVKGGGGFDDRLVLTSAGTVAAGGVSAVEIYQLAGGGANKLTLTNGNFTNVLGGHISVYGGSGGNTIDGSGLTAAADNLIIYGGGGADVLKGGAGNDIFVFTAAALTATDIVNGGKGNDELLADDRRDNCMPPR